MFFLSSEPSILYRPKNNVLYLVIEIKNLIVLSPKPLVHYAPSESNLVSLECLGESAFTANFDILYTYHMICIEYPECIFNILKYVTSSRSLDNEHARKW